ncbi:MAG: carotenoid 1,2-hydratase [Pseudomonadota bacterium]
MSADGKRAISIIAFIGSVFSPWYKWSGRKDPFNNVCINVATYGLGGKFTMTDRGRSALRASQDTFEVGPSKLHWDGDTLVIDINEQGAPPTFGAVRGQVRLTPKFVTDIEVLLAEDGSHIWRPFAPSADIEVRLEQNGWSWDGHGYFDANFGTAALEDDFSYWTWGRFPHSMGSVCFYDANRRDGSELNVSLMFENDGSVRVLNPPPKAKFKRSLWQVYRETRADAGYQPSQVAPMLDAPFYNRAQVKTQFAGEETIGVHESLDLNRFRSPLLKPMLAVRVPRRPKWTFRD